MLNSVEIQGRLTRDVEVKSTTTGKAVASFSIACERDTKERETDFINVTAWNETANFIASHFRKGSPILIKGRLQTKSYEDREGNKRTIYEIVTEKAYFCGGKSDGVTEENTVTKSAPAPSRLSEKEENALYEQSKIGGVNRPYVEYEEDGDLPF